MQPFDLLKEARTLPVRHVRQGGYLYRSGDLCNGNIYIVVEGTMVQVDRQEAFIFGTETGPGGVIGDIEVMSGAPERLQSWKAKSLDVKLAILEKRAADLMGSLHPEFFLLLLKSAIDHLNAAERKLIEKQ
jgi:CRP-like cAMP-binding protein